jgi:hypothetical protein
MASTIPADRTQRLCFFEPSISVSSSLTGNLTGLDFRIVSHYYDLCKEIVPCTTAADKDFGGPTALKFSQSGCVGIEFVARKTFLLKLAFSPLLIVFVYRAQAEELKDVEYGQAQRVHLLLDAHIPDGPGPFRSCPVTDRRTACELVQVSLSHDTF